MKKTLLTIALWCVGTVMMHVSSLGREPLSLPAPDQTQLAPEFPALFAVSERMFEQAANECDAVYDDIAVTTLSQGVPARTASTRRYKSASNKEAWNWYILPDGLIWRSYLADPQEPRIGMVIYGDTNEGAYWDATVGGRVGLLRYGTPDAKRPSGWQWDFEGAVITRLDILNAEDVDSMDYRFGTEITAAEGAWAMKFGYFHISSHVGDEYIERNPTYQRINYVTESAIFGLSYSPNAAVRFYGESVYSFSVSGGAKPFQFQTGFEYTPVAKVAKHGAPFAAINLNFREAVDYDVSTTAQIGWGFQGPESGRRYRVGMQYANGPTSQYQFFTRREEYLGMGFWFDY